MGLPAKLRSLPQLKPLKPMQRRFLLALSAHNMRIEPAAKRIGIEPKTHYNWLEKPDYKQGYEFVKKMFADYLEADMMDECITGQEKPVIYQGAITGYYREKNTREREIILKGLKPEYRDSFSPAGAAAPITLSIISPIAQPAEIDVTPPKKDE